MSHITCKRCGSNEHFALYGLALGGMGGYTVCECGLLLEYSRDMDDYDEDMLRTLVRDYDQAFIDLQFNGRAMVPGDLGMTTHTPAAPEVSE